MAKKRDIVKKINPNKKNLTLKTNHLLVIGIDKYEDKGIPNLNNAVRDAQRFVEILHTNYQFEATNTIELYNKTATKDNILEAFDRLIKSLNKEDNLVLYFSGHGDLVESVNRGFWIPTEARLEKRGDYLSNTDVTDFFRALDTHHIFAIVDACFSGALSRNIEKLSYNQRVDLKPSRWLLSSGSLEKVSDGAGKHSPFANSLFSALIDTDKLEINVFELCKEVLSTIDSNTKDQTPIGQPLNGVGHLMGLFVFYRKGYYPKIEIVSKPKLKPVGANRGGEPTRSASEESAPAMTEASAEAEIVAEEAIGIVAEATEEAEIEKVITIENSENIISGSKITVGGDFIIGGGNGNDKEEEAILDLGSGNLLYDIPDTMRLEKVSKCLVRIASTRKNLLQDIQTTTTTIIRDLHKITEVMGVELIDVSGGTNFKILDGSTEEQLVEKEWYTEWTFYVTPLVAGQHTLLLRLSEIKLVNNKERKRDITFEEIVQVVAENESIKRIPEKAPVFITTFPELKSYLKEILKEDLATALRSYEKVMASDFKNDITLQLGGYNRANKDYTNGLSTLEQRDRTFARIRYALTQMIDDLEEKEVVADFLSMFDTTKSDTIKLDSTKKMEYKNSKGEEVLLDLEKLEKAGLKGQADLIIKKLNHIKKARIVETDASKQFQYDVEIEEMEKQLKEIKDQLD